MRAATSPLLTLLTLLTLPGSATSPAAPAGTVARPAAAGRGAVVVPDRFLRRWDPVTIFFEREVGAAAGTPEDRPERWVTVSPPHAGAFTWLDARTLQFRPADAWSPLERSVWTVEGREVVLHSLMAAPQRTVPEADASGLDPVAAITLSFADPIAADALAAMTTIELRPLPGVGVGEARWLTADDFTVKAVERAAPADPAAYALVLDDPIPFATRAVVHLRLALDDDARESFAELAFTTAEPFRVVAVGSRSHRLPLTLDGVTTTADQAIDAGRDDPVVVVELSAAPAEMSAVDARRLVRFTPAVERLTYQVEGRTLEISGDFAWDTVYRVAVEAAALRDRNGRPLELRSPSAVHLFFPRRPAYLRWGQGQGVVERFGPKMVPVEGRGHERFDLRVYPVDPLDRSFWPFPDRPVSRDEAERPPGPGEEPPPYNRPYHIGEDQLADHLAVLGSPPVSAIVALPLRREGAAASFGLDLSPHLAALGGADRPGHYLVGLRALDRGAERQWLRLQVSDLSLTTVEEPWAVRFVVTSLSTARPVAGAEVTVEVGRGEDGPWQVYAAGTTDSTGSFTWKPSTCDECSVLRLRVRSGEDWLVIDPTRPPDGFADGTWSPSDETWLQWATYPDEWRGPQPEEVSHLFTERPVYRPEESVHIKGYVRLRAEGRLAHLELTKTAVVVVGPGDLEWRFPVALTEAGSFHWEFSADDLPTGDYSTYLEGWRPANGTTFTSDSTTFKVEAYRLPRFEVDLHGLDRAPLDRPFDVTMTATYYAGGRVVDRPVAWRVTQFPATFTPTGWPGFLFSSDGRFSTTGRFEATAALERADVTDAEGAARITVDPTLETTAQPRTYVVEATVTGADDQTVTATRQITALPPFVLGLKLPRFVERAALIEPEVVAVGPDDAALPGLQLTLRLKHRQWHSYLQASDFSNGEARYITDVVDETVLERKLVSGDAATRESLPIATAGVYIVELEARDKVGRAQVVAVDLYAGGDEPVSWAKPSSRQLTVRTDAKNYDPGATATLVVESPFQSGAALVVVEAPAGNRYHWLDVVGGAATFRLTVEPTWTPRLPVHVVLMRGRVPDTEPVPGTTTDLGKPATLAATTWLEIEPRGNRLELTLEHPERALPGAEVEVTVRLADPDGRPLEGEVTLWLVDQAVLALGRERRLDPLPDFITPVSSWLAVRDTREEVFGFLPFATNPGGDEAAEDTGLLDRATVRKNFQPVPFYDPRLLVGADGVATVRVKLPDDLTNFKLRAKAVSGWDRFGFATGTLAVRLPLIVQPALPRFVRPGDRFTATAVGRVVEGEGGPGAVAIRVTGADLTGPARQEVGWVPDLAQRLEFPLSVPTPELGADGEPVRAEIVVRVGVERHSDGASDAFEVALPIAPDRLRVADRLLAELSPGTPLELPRVTGAARPGSVRRSTLVSSQPALVRMAAGLSFLLEYPHHCTEQRLARARAFLALKSLRDSLAMTATGIDPARAVDDVLTWIPSVLDGRGLVAYWPGSTGYVSLTAWSLEFLVEARTAGFAVDAQLEAGLVRVLQQSLRSDYGHFIDGESFAERCYALAALTRAGRFDPAYAAELARKARTLNLEATAKVLQAFAAVNQADSEAARALAERLWQGVVVRLWQEREVYGGLQDLTTARNDLILPSESRTLAEVTSALALTDRDRPRFQVLVDGLVRRGRGEGGGASIPTAAARRPRAGGRAPGAAGDGERVVALDLGGQRSELRLGPTAPLAHRLDHSGGPASVTLVSGGAGGPPTVVRGEVSWIPAGDGAAVAAASSGFVVSRALAVIRGETEPAELIELTSAGREVELTVGQVVEDRVQVVNPADRAYVAIVVPLAAGMEPLNPRLATAPPEARPSRGPTLEPSYAAFLDDHVAFYYDHLPKGTYDLLFRTRATVAGRFTQPPAAAEMMYDGTVRGHGNGARVVIVPAGR